MAKNNYEDEFEKRKKAVTDFNYFTDKPNPDDDWGYLPHIGISMLGMAAIYFIVWVVLNAGK